MHRHTLRNNLQSNNITYGYTEISDADLDILIEAYTQEKPESGIRYVTGFLRHHGLNIQRRRIIESLHRVDPIGRTLQERRAIVRRIYHVARPNALWHIDGHHKIIRWGIVIHGIVDGYDRVVNMDFIFPQLKQSTHVEMQVVGIQASNNNRSRTVCDGVFSDSIEQYGYPSRMRGDHGGENKDVAIKMIMQRGVNRGSFIWGS